MPLSHRTAQKLCDVARPARYGLREKTLLDPRVRDTWEIGKRQIMDGCEPMFSPVTVPSMAHLAGRCVG